MTLVSIGYEGRDIDEFVAELAARDVDVLADVRLNAISRRRGFSKTALRTALAAAGIEYRHLRELGNPRENRPLFSGPRLELGRATYRSTVLQTEAGARALAELRALAAEHCVAVMCVERDESRCHRKVVLDALR